MIERVDTHLALHGLLRLTTAMVVGLDNKVVEVLHDVLELCLGGKDRSYGGVSLVRDSDELVVQSEVSAAIFSRSLRKLSGANSW